MLGNWKASTNHQFWGCMLNFIGVPTQTFAINFHIFRTKSNKMCLKKQVAQIFGCNYVFMGHFIPTGPKSGFCDRKFIVWPTWPRGLVVKQDKVSEVKGKICNQNTKTKNQGGKASSNSESMEFWASPLQKSLLFRDFSHFTPPFPPGPRPASNAPARFSTSPLEIFSKVKGGAILRSDQSMETALNSSPCV